MNTIEEEKAYDDVQRKEFVLPRKKYTVLPMLKMKILFLLLVMTIASVLISLLIGIDNENEHQEIFTVSSNLQQFHSKYLLHISNARRLACMPRVYEQVYNDSKIIYEEIELEFENIFGSVDGFKKSWHRSKNQASQLRSIKDRIEDVIHEGYQVINLGSNLVTASISWPQDTIEYLLSFDTADRNAANTASVMALRIRKARNALIKLSHDAGKTTIATFIVSSGIAIIALICIFFLVLNLLHNTKSKLFTLEKLVKQQLHEVRNLYSPVLVILEALSDISRGSTQEIDLHKLNPDLQSAISLLKDAETMQKARLDCFNIMRGNYICTLKTFNLLDFMHTHLHNQEAIYQGTLPADASGSIEFKACFDHTFTQSVDNFTTMNNTTILINCDPFILEHVAKNVLSNARKFTAQGKILFQFVGCIPQSFHQRRNKKVSNLLCFRVIDTGSGIPKNIRSHLFCQEVTTGNIDRVGHRGTGLGLPSCDIFCSAAQGYIRLVKSRVVGEEESDQQEGNVFLHNASGSIFEFAIRGNIVDISTNTCVKTTYEQVKTQSPSRALGQQVSIDDYEKKILPDNIEIIVVDDSEVNRRAVVIRLQKVARQTRATGWTFVQFSTAEAAQSHLQSAANNPLTIVTMDHNMLSKGGNLSGSDAIRFLISIHYKGCIVSSSGDPDKGIEHIALGAHFSWPKPLPSTSHITDDLSSHFNKLPLPHPDENAAFRLSTTSSPSLPPYYSNNIIIQDDDNLTTTDCVDRTLFSAASILKEVDIQD